MATVGQALTAPESGWKRYDAGSNIANFKPDASWGTTPHASHFGGSSWATGVGTTAGNGNYGGYVEFAFSGSKLRVMGYSHIDYSNDCKLTIDGVTHVFSTSYSAGYQTLLFNIEGLSDDNHKVKIEQGTNRTYQRLYIDSFDVGTNDEVAIILFYKKFLISADDQYNSIVLGGYSDNLIPKMTSRTAPSGIVESSNKDASQADWKAFNQTNETYLDSWWSAGYLPAWLSYEFTEPMIISKYSISSYNYNTRQYDPKAWTFEGWDGSQWIVLDTQANQSFTQGQTKEYEFENQNSCIKYRINVTELTVGGGVAIGELQMFRKNENVMVVVDSTSEHNFINHGMSPNTEFDLSLNFQKMNVVKSISTALGNGKVYEHTIDFNVQDVKIIEL